MKRHVALLAALLMAVAACGGGDDPAAVPDVDATATTTVTTTTTTTATTSPTVAPASTEPAATTSVTTAEPPTDTDPPASDPPSSEPATTDPGPTGRCLVGDWVVAEAEMNRFYDALQADIDGIDFTVTGQTFLSFGVDTYEYRPDFVLELSMSGIDGRGDASGNITGSYEVVDGVLTTTSDVNAVTLVIEVGGQVIDGSAMENEILSSSPINSAPVDCSGSTPVIDFATGTGSVPITLTPA